MTALLNENLPLIATAPGGVKTLRALILDLAVRGKLVPQDPNDEPASELLKRIANAKFERKKKTGDARIKIEPDPTPDELDMPLPLGWAVQSFENLFLFIDYRGNTPPKTDDGIPLITAKNIRMGYLNREPREYIAKATFKTWMTRGFPEIGDLFFTTEAPLANICLNDIEEPFALAQRTICFQPYGRIDTKFLMFAVMSDVMQSLIDKHATGMTAKGIKAANLKPLPIPIPPLAEQHRIVARVDELMALCDQLEAQQADAEAAHATLVKTLLDTLTQSQDSDDFAANWQRLGQHFDTIFTTEASLDALKQTLLQLAVMGKLVRQDPNDEPASAFLGRIRSERARLIAKKQIKADKPQSAITGDDLPFTSPSGWEWVRFDEVVLISGGLTLGRTFAGRELVSRPYLRVANVQRGHLVLTEVKEVAVPPEEVEKYRLLPQDLLITEGGDWDKVGRTAIWRGEVGECLHQNHVFKARPFVPDFNDRWMEMYLNSTIARSYFARASKQTTNLASINMTQLKACLLPIPPLAEQHRIVARFDELMALCDVLKARLAESRTIQGQLATALVERAVAA